VRDRDFRGDVPEGGGQMSYIEQRPRRAVGRVMRRLL